MILTWKIIAILWVFTCSIIIIGSLSGGFDSKVAQSVRWFLVVITIIATAVANVISIVLV